MTAIGSLPRGVAGRKRHRSGAPDLDGDVAAADEAETSADVADRVEPEAVEPGAVGVVGDLDDAVDIEDLEPLEVADHQRGRWFTRPAVILPVVTAVLAGVLVIGLAEWGGTAGPGAGEAIVTVHGSAFVDRADGTSATVTDSVRLHPGDRIDIRTGRADFELAAGVRFEGLARSGTAGSKVADTSLEMALVPTLRSGHLLVRAPSATEIHAGIADVAVPAGSVARITRSYAVTVGAYRGPATITSAGQHVRVPALRSAEAAATGDLGRIHPLDVGTGRWDRRYLAPALTLDRELGPLARGMRADGVDPKDLLDAVRLTVPSHPGAATVTRLVHRRSPRLDDGIGLAVVGSGQKGTFAHRWARAVAFHDAGATWGLVAMDIGAAPTDVAGALRDAIDGKALSGSVDRTGGSDGNGSSNGSGADGTGRGGSTDGTATDGNGTATGSGTGTGGTGTGSGGTGTGTGGTGTGTGTGGTGVTVPGVTVPGVTVPGITVPGITVPGITVPGTAPAVPAIPGVTTPTIPLVTVVTGVVGGVTGVLGTVLPGLIPTTTTTRPRGATTTTTGLLGGLFGGLGL